MTLSDRMRLASCRMNRPGQVELAWENGTDLRRSKIDKT